MEVGGAVARHLRTGATMAMISSPRQVLHTVGGRRTQRSQMCGLHLGILKQQRSSVLVANVDEDVADIASVAVEVDHNHGNHLSLNGLCSQRGYLLTTMVELLGAKPSPSVELFSHQDHTLMTIVELLGAKLSPSVGNQQWRR